jgi:REP element-mobilizing transposase RayT
MANTYSSIFIHAVFTTKNHQRLISSSLRERLYPYMCGIARQNEYKILCVCGIDDHVHVLFSLNTSVSVAKAVQLIKGGLSKWIHDTFPELSQFSWQVGYGAFSVSASKVEDTKRYIESQETHHRKLSFREEYIMFLKKHNVTYDEKYLLG